MHNYFRMINILFSPLDLAGLRGGNLPVLVLALLLLLPLAACQPQGKGGASSAVNFALPAPDKVNWTGDKELDLAFLAYSTGKFDEAFKRFSALHDSGNSTATAMLGRAYEQGRGVAPDQEKALELFKKAAEKGDPFGLIYLSHMRESKLQAEKFEAMNKLAQGGNIPAKNIMGVLLETDGDYCNALKLFEQAAKAGYPPAILNLSRFYHEGSCTQPDPAKAREIENTAYRMGYKLSK